MGKLGRQRIAIIYEQSDRFEMPSDIHGIVYIPASDWEARLRKELDHVGCWSDAEAPGGEP